MYKRQGDYSVVVAGFDDESDYAIVSKVVPASESDNDEIQLTMSGITDEVTTVELCVINKLRKRIVSLVAMECTDIADTILMDAGKVDASMYKASQQKIFNATFTACHGPVSYTHLKNAYFKAYPKLNHLLQEGSGKATPF